MREIYSMFDLSFNKLSERFFKGTTWPAAESIAHLVDHDHVFCLLYKVCPYICRVLLCTGDPDQADSAQRSLWLPGSAHAQGSLATWPLALLCA